MDFKNYLIISNICLVISFLMFRLLNRDETMFRQRRIYILLSIILSLTLPFSNFIIRMPQPTNVVVLNTFNEFANINSQTEIKDTINSGGFDTLSYIYFAVLALFILNILLQLLRVFWLYISNEKEDDKIVLVESRRVHSPFSFFNWIFIPKHRIREDDINSIIIHEKIHSKEYHTLDNLILEIACALMWFNPTVWIFKRYLRLIHEYLADEGSLNSGIERTSYQSLLINQVAEDKLIVIPSSFKSNYLKKRLIMMTKYKNADHNSLIKRRMIPLSSLILVVIILQGFFPVNIKGQNQPRESENKQAGKDKSEQIVVVGYGSQDSIPGNIKIRNDGTSGTLFIIDGKEVNRDVFESLSPDRIQSISVLKNKEQMKIYTQKDFDGVIVITTKKDYEGTNEKPQQMNTIVVRGYGTPDSTTAKGIEIRSTGDSNLKNTLFIIDEKEMSREDFENLKPDRIKTMTVIKNKDQMKIYTSKDYDGVIVVTTKQ